MKTGREKLFFRIFLICFALALLLAAAFCAVKLLQHEKRQSGDIEELQGILYAKEEEKKNVAVTLPEAFTLYSALEEQLNDFFPDTGSFNAWQKLACGQDIHFLVVGDSIGALGWTYDVADWIAENYRVGCDIKNISLGGNTSYGGFVSLAMLDDGISYDLILVCYGENDLPDAFKTEYEALIRTILKRYDNCSIIPILESSQREYNEKMQWIQQVADYYNLVPADTIAAFENSGYAYEKLSWDGKHPSDLGGEIYAQTVETVIRENVAAEYKRKTERVLAALSGNEPLNADGFSVPMAWKEPLQQDTSAFERFRYISSSEFSRSSETEWEISLNDISGVLGINRNMCPGVNHLRVYLNDELFFDGGETDWQLVYHLMTIDRLSDHSDLFDGNLKISFSSKEAADGFFGIILTDYEEVN